MRKSIKNNLTLSIVNAALLIGVTTAVASDSVTNTDVSPAKNYIPALSSGFGLSASALYLQPNSSNLDYAILTNPILIGAGPVGLLTPDWDKQYIDPDFSFGFNIGARYIFPNEGDNGTFYDVALEWTHLNTSDSDAVEANLTDPVQFVGPDYQIGPMAGPIRMADSNVAYDFDVLNLDLGVYKDYGNHVRMRFFGGLSGANIKQTLTTTFQGTVKEIPEPDIGPDIDPIPSNVGPFSVTSENTSKFTGLGPRVGSHTTFYLPKGFGIVGEAAVSALIGRQKTDMSFTSTSARLTNVGINENDQRISTENTTKVVPVIDAKLGLNHTSQLSNSTLVLELGYQAAVYINAIDEVYPTSLVTDPSTPLQTGTIAVNTMGESQSDFSATGPYFKASLKL